MGNPNTRSCRLMAAFARALPAVALAAAALAAAPPPNLSGAWKPDYSLGEIDERAGTDCCSTLYRKLTIAQKDDRVTIGEDVLMARQNWTRESTYKTDGSESENKGWSGRKELSKAVWKENKLIISSSQMVRNRTIETITTLSLNAAGDSLTMVKELRSSGPGLRERILFIRSE